MVDAREYHERTNHTPERVRSSSHRLDPATKPRPYKVYADLPSVEPDGPAEPPEGAALSAIVLSDATPTVGGDDTAGEPDVHTLCQYAAGVTKTLRVRGQEMRFRAAACTGKLYHVDLYAVTGDCGAFEPGVYHYDPDGDTFDVLREGDYRGVLAAASGGQQGVAEAPVTFVATSEWWRNAWKYRARTYRHAFWDSGTILANLLAVAHAGGHRAAVVAGFADRPVVELLGLDPDAEAPVELVPVGSGAPVPDPVDVPAIDPEETPLSPDQEAYPLIPDAWRQSTLADGEAAREWRQVVADGADDIATSTGHDPGAGAGERITLEPVDADTATARPVGATIERRGSLREYSHEAVSDRKLATVLDRALGGTPTDCGPVGPGHLLDCYVIVHAVDGVPTGTYRYHHDDGELERVGDADRDTSGHLALDQPVVGDAAVNVYLTADVDRVVEQFGNRGYRLTQLAGGLSLGRLYLATYAHLALGGRGFTFYDPLVTEYLTPEGTGQAPMTLFAFGRPAE